MVNKVIEAHWQPRTDWNNILEIDQEIAEKMSVCEACGHEGLTFLPMWDVQGSHRYYHAVARCPQCNEESEF